jgi:hypothetical protein
MNAGTTALLGWLPAPRDMSILSGIFPFSTDSESYTTARWLAKFWPASVYTHIVLKYVAYGIYIYIRNIGEIRLGRIYRIAFWIEYNSRKSSATDSPLMMTIERPPHPAPYAPFDRQLALEIYIASPDRSIDFYTSRGFIWMDVPKSLYSGFLGELSALLGS